MKKILITRKLIKSSENYASKVFEAKFLSETESSESELSEIDESELEYSLLELVTSDSDAARARISTATDRRSCADSELVIEAVPEILDLKISIFSELDEINCLLPVN